MPESHNNSLNIPKEISEISEFRTTVGEIFKSHGVVVPSLLLYEISQAAIAYALGFSAKVQRESVRRMQQ